MRTYIFVLFVFCFLHFQTEPTISSINIIASPSSGFPITSVLRMSDVNVLKKKDTFRTVCVFNLFIYILLVLKYDDNLSNNDTGIYAFEIENKVGTEMRFA